MKKQSRKLDEDVTIWPVFEKGRFYRTLQWRNETYLLDCE